MDGFTREAVRVACDVYRSINLEVSAAISSKNEPHRTELVFSSFTVDEFHCSE